MVHHTLPRSTHARTPSQSAIKPQDLHDEPALTHMIIPHVTGHPLLFPFHIRPKPQHFTTRTGHRHPGHFQYPDISATQDAVHKACSCSHSYHLQPLTQPSESSHSGLPFHFYNTAPWVLMYRGSVSLVHEHNDQLLSCFQQAIHATITCLRSNPACKGCGVGRRAITIIGITGRSSSTFTKHTTSRPPRVRHLALTLISLCLHIQYSFGHLYEADSSFQRTVVDSIGHSAFSTQVLQDTTHGKRTEGQQNVMFCLAIGSHRARIRSRTHQHHLLIGDNELVMFARQEQPNRRRTVFT